MTLFGPVSDAAHGGKMNPWFGILVGAYVLTSAWIIYFKKRGKAPKVKLGSMLAITAICGVLLAIGIWQLFR